MSEPIQGDNSSTPGDLSGTRKRRRPRKGKFMNSMESTHVPPGFGVKENLCEEEDASDGIVGQAVSGVVEAVFDAGYFLTVRIGNSDTTLRGVVFKPGHCAPVTAENDVAPHARMIRRNDHNVMHGHSRTQQNGSPPANRVYGLVQYTSKKAAKSRYTAPIAPSVPLVGARGTVVPVILQPANLSTPRYQPHQDSLHLRDDEVHTVQPLAMLPPDASAPTGQTPAAQSHSHADRQVSEGNAQTTNSSRLEEEEGKADMSSSVAKDDSGASHSQPPTLLQGSHFQGVNSALQMQSASITEPLKNFAAGRMTELLLAVQENMTEKQVQHAEYF